MPLTVSVIAVCALALIVRELFVAFRTIHFSRRLSRTGQLPPSAYCRRVERLLSREADRTGAVIEQMDIALLSWRDRNREYIMRLLSEGEYVRRYGELVRSALARLTA